MAVLMKLCMYISVYNCMYLYLFLLPYVCPYLFELAIDDGQIKHKVIHFLFIIIDVDQKKKGDLFWCSLILVPVQEFGHSQPSEHT